MSFANVNNLKIYYESHSSGRSLILLHGGAGSTGMFDDVLLPALSKDHQVITVDLQAHGRTADIDRALRFELMADDIAALIKELKLDKTDLAGYSLGGGVALRVAIQYPELVTKLVVISAAFKRNGWYPEVLQAMSSSNAESAEQMKSSPMYQAYAKIAPRPQDWPILFTKLGDMLRRDYDWSADVASLKIPTMIAFGDADSISPSHAARFFELLGGGKRDAGWDGSGMISSRLLILPATTHYTIFNSPLLAAEMVSFLK